MFFISPGQKKHRNTPQIVPPYRVSFENVGTFIKICFFFFCYKKVFFYGNKKFFQKISGNAAHITHIQSLKYSSYSYLTIRMMLLIPTLHELTFARITKCMYDSHMNTTIHSRRLCICFACCLWLSSFFVNATTTKSIIVDE